MDGIKTVLISSPWFFHHLSLRINDDSERTFVHAIKENVNASSGTQMVVALTPNNRKDRYDGIKKLCNVEFGGKLNIVVNWPSGYCQLHVKKLPKIVLFLNCHFWKKERHFLAIFLKKKLKFLAIF